MLFFANEVVECEMNLAYVKGVIDKAKAANKELVEMYNYAKYSPEVDSLEALLGSIFLTTV